LKIARSRLALGLVFFCACSATTTLQATQPNTEIKVKTGSEATAPTTESFKVTSFGNYEFEAKTAGHDPMYGILPLKFNGGYLALDIFLFAPATFFNLREVFHLMSPPVWFATRRTKPMNGPYTRLNPMSLSGPRNISPKISRFRDRDS
jgi:hypothetical protein